MGDFEIDTMDQGDLSIAIDWAADEGWNPGLHDASSFFRADRAGFIKGSIAGDPVGSISAVRYGATFGFIGLYIVKPGLRGQGFGFRLWQAAMDRLQGRNIGLDGVVEQQANYGKSGFRYAYRNVRFETRGTGHGALPKQIVPLADVEFAQIEKYDREFFPDDRRAFLRRWVAQPGGTGLAARSGGELAGYGVVRPCRSGYKIGPLFADALSLADSLLSGLLGQVGAGEAVYFDAPEVNPHAMELADRYHMRKVFETARMYTGAVPELPMDRTYGVTTFELG